MQFKERGFLIENLLKLDHIWKDNEKYVRDLDRNPIHANRIKRARVALIVDLTLAEYRVGEG